jgi:hypothetical protein
MRHGVRKGLELLVGKAQGFLVDHEIGDVRVHAHPEQDVASLVAHRHRRGKLVVWYVPSLARMRRVPS